MAPDKPGNEINLIAFHQLIGLLFTDIWLETIVFNNKVNVFTAHFTANMRKSNFSGRNHVFAKHPGGRCECGYKADFNPILARMHMAAGKRQGNRQAHCVF